MAFYHAGTSFLSLPLLWETNPYSISVFHAACRSNVYDLVPIFGGLLPWFDSNLWRSSLSVILFYAGLLGCESGSPIFGRCRLVPNQPFSLINLNFCTTMVSWIQSSCGLTAYKVVAAVAYVPLAAGGWGHVQRQWDGKRHHRVLHRLGSLYLLLSAWSLQFNHPCPSGLAEFVFPALCPLFFFTGYRYFYILFFCELLACYCLCVSDCCIQYTYLSGWSKLSVWAYKWYNISWIVIVSVGCAIYELFSIHS